jgi:hypothetical protein
VCIAWMSRGADLSFAAAAGRISSAVIEFVSVILLISVFII